MFFYFILQIYRINLFAIQEALRIYIATKKQLLPFSDKAALNISYFSLRSLYIRVLFCNDCDYTSNGNTFPAWHLLPVCHE